MLRTRLVAAALLLSAPLAVLAAEDLTIVSKVTASRGAPTTSTQYITADKVRTSDGQTDTIFEITTGRMIHIDHKNKEYYESSLEELQAGLAQVNEMLKANPMMERMLGDMTTVEVRKGDGTGSYAGYDCNQYFMTIGNMMEIEFCNAPGLEMPIEYYDARKMAYAAMGPMASRFEKMLEEMKKLEGYAVWTKTDAKAMGMDVSSVSEAIEVKKGPIPASAFEPPAGYKKKKSPYQR